MPEQVFRSRNIRLAMLLTFAALLCFFAAQSIAAELDFSAWKSYRNLRIPSEFPSGIAAVALESNVLEKCRPDLADVRIMASDRSEVQFTIMESPGEEDLNPFPVRVFRTSRNAGKWTDIWIDKSAKTLTKGVLLQTSSRDFLRKVEIRGSDNGKEEYVVSMDGLVMDVSKPLPIHNLRLVHTVNNFQYVHLRIIDDDMPPLKIEGVLCYPPSPTNYMSRPLDFRIIEKKTDIATNTTTLVLDLGEKRFPLERLAITTPARDFSAKLILSGASSSTPDIWKKFHEGTVFRVQKEDAVKDDLTAMVKPQNFRYLKLELIGSKAVPVEKIDLTASMRAVVFNYTKGFNYRLLYDNPSAVAVHHDDKLLSVNMTRIASASLETSLDEEQKNLPAPPAPQRLTEVEPVQSSNWTKAFGIAMLLIGLLFLFGLMLRARSLKRAERRRNSRIVYTRFE